MKFLIVNNFRKNKERRAKDFADFSEAIRKFSLEDNILQDTETSFFTVDSIEDLKHYLYDQDYEHLQHPESGKNFNLIDAVFINGDCSFLPWQKQNLEIFVLIKMCINSDKPLFCTSGAMLTMVYLISTDTENVLNIITQVSADD